MKKKMACSIILGLALTVVCAAPAMADSRKVVTLGADLTTDQQNTMLRYFGVSSDSVDIIYINNTDEREHLGSYVPLEQIGTKTFSCALVAPTSSGGIQVKTANLSWVTCNMIASTLSTSGVTNCQVVAASPFEVSGTGALTGVIMAYETASEEELDQTKKDLANEELVATGNLADEVGQSKATAVINETKLQVVENNVTDIDEITNIVNNVSTTYDVTIEEDQSQEIAELMQKIAEQDYDITQLKATLERVQANVAGDAGASEEEQAVLESEAQAAESEALAAAESEAAETAEETGSDDGVVVVLNETEASILDNTDITALEESGVQAQEGSTTQTVQEQSEAAQSEAETEFAISTGEELTVEGEEQTADTESSDQTAETEASVQVEISEENQTAETTAEENQAQESEEGSQTEVAAEETEETLTADMLDEESRVVYDTAEQDLDLIFAAQQVTAEDGTVVYLTETAAQQVPEAIEAYVLKVLVQGADTVAAEEAADPEISQTIVEETQEEAPDANYEDADLKQIDKYIRRLVLQDSEELLADSQLENQDAAIIYNAVMEALENAFGVEQTEETSAEELTAEDASAEEYSEEAVEDAEYSDSAEEEYTDEFADFVEETGTY